MMAESDIGSSFIPSLYKPSSLLPIARHRDTMLYVIETFPITIITGQTGSGKTTQIPQFLDQAGWCAEGKTIAITQPRRVAATTVAARVAEEMRCNLGQEVGYSIRFEDMTSSATRIKFLTDGLLLREALVDPLLSRYSVIMVDEAHERSLSSDILLGLLKKIMKRRPELRIVVSSATLDAENFLQFFAGDSIVENGNGSGELGGSVGRIISLEGRMYPVDIHYLEEPAEDYVERAIKTVFDIHAKEAEGDILIFLTGREEIDATIEIIADRIGSLNPKGPSLLPLPLYAGLSTDEQMYVFEPAPEDTRKVIIATNIAEASVTIDGIVYVIDCGFVKLRAYNPTTGIETLTAVPVSKASATQRAGRAGRTNPGKCYRLYTEQNYANLEESTVPEIQRSNLAPVILQLKALGIDNIARFDYLTPPPAELVIRALELLYSLGALDNYAKLTQPLGTRMAELAVEPMMGKVLLSAATFDCLSEILSIAAMTSLQGAVWFSHEGEKKAQESARRKFAAEEGDHLTLLNVYQAFVTKGKKEAKWCRDNYLNFRSMSRSVSIRNQLKRYLERFGNNVDESLGRDSAVLRAGGVDKAEKIRRCLTSGFFAHAARMQPDGSFRTVDGGTVLYAHPSSLLFNRKADWVIFHEIMETGNKTFIRDITKIEKAWLTEYAPEYYQVTQK
ncbi:ATP dependent RNA helicase [Cenococcum geophilum 1.58]|uniref:ATP dependent RNA helicase n=1 Tax=Cenococcum geophilum 1.58 TaxID=794803 RepID=UPI00358E10B9|nr:ATP dependent RNA helicase [Cenococcum geophilum 1.58]